MAIKYTNNCSSTVDVRSHVSQSQQWPKCDILNCHIMTSRHYSHCNFTVMSSWPNFESLVTQRLQKNTSCNFSQNQNIMTSQRHTFLSHVLSHIFKSHFKSREDNEYSKNYIWRRIIDKKTSPIEHKTIYFLFWYLMDIFGH